MYVRINQVKFPNKMAKEAVQKHAKSTLSNFGVNGRIARLTVNISEISHSVISIWKDKETFKKYGVDHLITDVVSEKPRAICFIDDKGYRFEEWGSTISFVERLK